MALENTFPELKWTSDKDKPYGIVLEVVEKTLAERAAGKHVTMAEVYERERALWDWQKTDEAAAHARKIPATSSATITDRQAPHNKFESRAAINSMLDKHGSIGQLAAALKR